MAYERSGWSVLAAYVIGSSALYNWRRNWEMRPMLAAVASRSLCDCPRSPAELASSGLSDFDFGSAPIRLMAPSPKLRVSRRLYAYTVHERSLPARSFFRLSEAVCIASPELCLVQSANAFSSARLLELVMELCGKYSLVPEASRGFVSHEFQLTSQSAIRAFLQEAAGMRGADKLARMLRYAQDGSRSPMETREYLLLCLPKRYGGYGLPKPTLNYRVDLYLNERQVSQRRYFECDMCWPHQKVVVEYDGHDDHESRVDRSRDAVKRNLLIARGYVVFTVTGGQIGKVSAFERTAYDIAAALGYRMRAFPDDWKVRHAALREELFKSIVGYEKSGRFTDA